MYTLNLVSGNDDKIKEAKEFLGDQVDLRVHRISLTEIQGSSKEIVIAKCREASKTVPYPIVVEDVSLHIDCLYGPGPYIKDFMKVGVEKIYELCKKITGLEKSSAYTQCFIAYQESAESEILLFVGASYGHIVKPRYSGKEDFSFNPMFQLFSLEKTFSELTDEERKIFTPRANVYAELLRYLRERTSE